MIHLTRIIRIMPKVVCYTSTFLYAISMRIHYR
jgi:hypothetical protein